MFGGLFLAASGYDWVWAGQARIGAPHYKTSMLQKLGGRTWKIEEKEGIKVELCTFYSAEVTALHSGLVSHHCR